MTMSKLIFVHPFVLCETLEQSSIHINVSTQTSHQRHFNVPCITAVHGLMTDGPNFIKYSTGKAEP